MISRCWTKSESCLKRLELEHFLFLLAAVYVYNYAFQDEDASSANDTDNDGPTESTPSAPDLDEVRF